MPSYNKILFPYHKMRDDMLRHLHSTYELPVYLKQYITPDSIEGLLVAAIKTELCNTLDVIIHRSKAPDYIVQFIAEEWPELSVRETHAIAVTVLNSPTHMAVAGTAQENINRNKWNVWEVDVEGPDLIVNCMGDFRIISFETEHMSEGYYKP